MPPLKKKKSKAGESIIPQAKLLRLFQIIAVLKSGHWTIRQLAERFDTSERTVYRYIRLLEEVDFLIEKDFDNRYFIMTSEDDPSAAQFSLEETRLIKKLIQSGAKANPLKNLLLKKLSLNSELDSMPRLFVQAQVGKFVEELANALSEKRQVILKGYHSANSNEIRDRLVEPIHFGDNYQSIMALDAEDQVCKQFKLDRIGEVSIQSNNFQFETLHKKKQVDIFGFTGDATLWLTWKMTMRAYLLLREEFPLAQSYLQKESDGYHFHAPVSNMEGPARFVMGLLDEIQVISPDEFKQVLKAKLNSKWEV